MINYFSIFTKTKNDLEIEFQFRVPNGLIVPKLNQECHCLDGEFSYGGRAHAADRLAIRSNRQRAHPIVPVK